MRATAVFAAILAGASLAQPLARADAAPRVAVGAPIASDLSVLTYNVRGLPWPIATGRGDAMRQIGARLAGLRAQGRQPTIVVLQEAFTPAAKALGRQAGYRFQVQGPSARASPGVQPEQAIWRLGENLPAALDSGLVILSDLPLGEVRRAPFPTGACAGTDCLAAKGIVLVSVAVPGRGPVRIATTHLNSRAASGAPFDRTHRAYARQARFVAAFAGIGADRTTPLIVAGDFNRGQRPVRSTALAAAFGPNLREALRERLAENPPSFGRAGDALWIRERARDMQFVFDAADARLEVVGAEIPFGTESDGSLLSDHMGFTIHYRLKRAETF